MDIYQQIACFKHCGLNVDSKKIKNPFRGDNSPGCFFKLYNNSLYFVDFGNMPTHMNYIDVLKLYYNCSTEEAIKKSKDINSLPSYEFKKELYIPKQNNYSVVNKEFSEFELEYWNQYNISKEILEKFEVESVSQVWNNSLLEFSAKKTSPIFSYKENQKLFKIYNPLGFIEQKFRSVCPIVEGLSKAEGEVLFLTSSYKDVMALYSIGFTAAAPSSESSYKYLEQHKEELFNKYKYIYIYFNNDETGKKYSKKLSLEVDKRFKYINNPDMLPKDPSDLIKKNGIELLKEIINEKFKRDRIYFH